MTVPVPARPNLHVALALALGRPTSWTDTALIADVETRCLPLLEPPVETVPVDGGETLFELENVAS